VNRARHYFLAGTGFAEDQDIAVECGYLANQAIDAADERRVAGGQNRRT
jgi:hypothetical protein